MMCTATLLSAQLFGDQLEKRHKQRREKLPIGRVVGLGDVATVLMVPPIAGKLTATLPVIEAYVFLRGTLIYFAVLIQFRRRAGKLSLIRLGSGNI
jgi:hypothetical protein